MYPVIKPGTNNHFSLLNIGSNTHLQLDSHIAGTALKHPATDITFNNIGTFWNSTDVNGVLLETNTKFQYVESTITGIKSGGTVTKVTSTTIDVTAGSGHYVDSWTTPENPIVNAFNFNATTGITLLMPDPSGFVSIYVDQNGIVGQKNGKLTNSETRIFSHLARAYYHAGVIDDVTQKPRILNGSIDSYFDYLSFIPDEHKVSGFAVKPVTAVLSIWQDIGSWFSPGVNWINDITNPNVQSFSANGNITTPLIFNVVFQDGSVYLASQTVIPAVYEKTPGIATALTTKQSTIHYFFKTFGPEQILQMGQKKYGNGKVARDNVEVDATTYIQFPGSESTLLSAQIYAQANASSFSNTNKAGIVNLLSSTSASRGIGVSTFLSLADVDPTTYVGQAGKTVTVDALETGLEFTIPPFLKLDGTNPMSGNINPVSDQLLKIGSSTNKFLEVNARLGKFIGTSSPSNPIGGTVDIRINGSITVPPGIIPPTGLVGGYQYRTGSGAAYHGIATTVSGNGGQSILCMGNVNTYSTGTAGITAYGGVVFGKAQSTGTGNAKISSTSYGDFMMAYAKSSAAGNVTIHNGSDGGVMFAYGSTNSSGAVSISSYQSSNFTKVSAGSYGSATHSFYNNSYGGIMFGYSSGYGAVSTIQTGKGSFVNISCNPTLATDTITVIATGDGSSVGGYAVGTSTWSATGIGSSILGHTNGGNFSTSGIGSSVGGYAGVGSYITAGGNGSISAGTTSNNFHIITGGNGSFAFGDATTANIEANTTGSNCTQFGVGVNTLSDSFQVGVGIRLIGTVGTPTTPRNGDMWVDSTGNVWIQSAGVAKNISNIV